MIAYSKRIQVVTADSPSYQSRSTGTFGHSVPVRSFCLFCPVLLSRITPRERGHFYWFYPCVIPSESLRLSRVPELFTVSSRCRSVTYFEPLLISYTRWQLSQCSRQEPRGRDPPHIQQGTWHLRELNIKQTVGINTSYAYCKYSTSRIERYKGQHSPIASTHISKTTRHFRHLFPKLKTLIDLSLPL